MEASAPDLVLTDIKMPRMDGMTALRTLRERDIDVPVIVLTAHGAVDTAVEATRLGAKAYLSKPFDLREVALAVEQVLEQHRLATEVRYLRHQTKAAYSRIIGQSWCRCMHPSQMTEVSLMRTSPQASTILRSGKRSEIH